MKKAIATLPSCALIAASAFLLAGCGGGGTTASNAPADSPAAVAAADPAPLDIQCGKVPATKGAQADVVIRAGAVDCPQATKLITDYFQKLSPDEVNSDGAGPVALAEWTCGSGPNDPVTTCSTEDSRQVDGVVAK
jgi:hypothetical protein